MKKERDWLDRHGRKRSKRIASEQTRVQIGLAIVGLLRRCIAALSVILLPLILVAAVLNWSKADIAVQIFGSIFCLIALNCGGWLIERLLRHTAPIN
jgi:uncharacterized protein YqhQ